MHLLVKRRNMLLSIGLVLITGILAFADDVPVNCSNKYVSGSNKVVFPLSNQNGKYNLTPYKCDGQFWADSRGSNWSSYCSTGWRQYTNKWTKSCINSYISGRKETVYPMANTSGKYNYDCYYCNGNFWVDSRGANWNSYCSTGWQLMPNLGEGCDTPAYSPAYWNNTTVIRLYNNCYNYATNARTDTFAQPGRAGGTPISSPITVQKVYNAVIADGLDSSSSTGQCQMNQAKVAVFVWPNSDYHWYRRDLDGRWSHKPGSTSATNLDNSGRVITNPETADRGPYTQFVGYFCTCSDTDQGAGHIYIR